MPLDNTEESVRTECEPSLTPEQRRGIALVKMADDLATKLERALGKSPVFRDAPHHDPDDGFYYSSLTIGEVEGILARIEGPPQYCSDLMTIDHWSGWDTLPTGWGSDLDLSASIRGMGQTRKGVQKSFNVDVVVWVGVITDERGEPLSGTVGLAPRV